MHEIGLDGIAWDGKHSQICMTSLVAAVVVVVALTAVRISNRSYHNISYHNIAIPPLLLFSHRRGRMNVLHNFFQKPLKSIINMFSESEPSELGDVKYHLGTCKYRLVDRSIQTYIHTYIRTYMCS